MKITPTSSKAFAKKSGDNNLIHLDKKFASNFFFSEPIVHGSNLAIIALKEKFKKKKYFQFSSITLDFKNYTNVNEHFKITHLKNKIKIKNIINEKLIITFDTRKGNISKVEEIFKILEYISKLIGTKIIGNAAIIFKVKINSLNKKYTAKKINIRKINENIKIINIINNYFYIEVICGKMKPFKPQSNKFNLDKKIIKIIKNKQFLFIGAKSDVAKILINSIKQYCNISTFSFRLQNKRKSVENNFIKLKKTLVNEYDYIFYMSSVKIFHGNKHNKNLLKTYRNIYCNFFKLIPEYIFKKKIKSKIFYPSTFALDDKNKFKNIEAYLDAKEKGENICNSKKFQKMIYCPRLPQMKSKSNYNILGFYEGQELYKIKKYLINFFNY
jgi:hypothetical protein